MFVVASKACFSKLQLRTLNGRLTGWSFTEQPGSRNATERTRGKASATLILMLREALANTVTGVVGLDFLQTVPRDRCDVDANVGSPERLFDHLFHGLFMSLADADAFMALA